MKYYTNIVYCILLGVIAYCNRKSFNNIIVYSSVLLCAYIVQFHTSETFRSSLDIFYSEQQTDDEQYRKLQTEDWPKHITPLSSGKMSALATNPPSNLATIKTEQKLTKAKIGTQLRYDNPSKYELTVRNCGNNGDLFYNDDGFAFCGKGKVKPDQKTEYPLGYQQTCALDPNNTLGQDLCDNGTYTISKSGNTKYPQVHSDFDKTDTNNQCKAIIQDTLKIDDNSYYYIGSDDQYMAIDYTTDRVFLDYHTPTEPYKPKTSYDKHNVEVIKYDLQLPQKWEVKYYPDNIELPNGNQLCKISLRTQSIDDTVPNYYLTYNEVTNKVTPSFYNDGENQVWYLEIATTSNGQTSEFFIKTVGKEKYLSKGPSTYIDNNSDVELSDNCTNCTWKFEGVGPPSCKKVGQDVNPNEWPGCCFGLLEKDGKCINNPESYGRYRGIQDYPNDIINKMMANTAVKNSDIYKGKNQFIPDFKNIWNGNHTNFKTTSSNNIYTVINIDDAGNGTITTPLPISGAPATVTFATSSIGSNILKGISGDYALHAIMSAIQDSPSPEKTTLVNFTVMDSKDNKLYSISGDNANNYNAVSNKIYNVQDKLSFPEFIDSEVKYTVDANKRIGMPYLYDMYVPGKNEKNMIKETFDINNETKLFNVKTGGKADEYNFKTFRQQCPSSTNISSFKKKNTVDNLKYTYAGMPWKQGNITVGIEITTICEDNNTAGKRIIVNAPSTIISIPNFSKKEKDFEYSGHKTGTDKKQLYANTLLGGITDKLESQTIDLYESKTLPAYYTYSYCPTITIPQVNPNPKQLGAKILNIRRKVWVNSPSNVIFADANKGTKYITVYANTQADKLINAVFNTMPPVSTSVHKIIQEGHVNLGVIDFGQEELVDTHTNWQQLTTLPDHIKEGQSITRKFKVGLDKTGVCADLNQSGSDSIIFTGTVCNIDEDGGYQVKWDSMSNSNISQECGGPGKTPAIWSRKSDDTEWNDEYLGSCGTNPTYFQGGSGGSGGQVVETSFKKQGMGDWSTHYMQVSLVDANDMDFNGPECGGFSDGKNNYNIKKNCIDKVLARIRGTPDSGSDVALFNNVNLMTGEELRGVAAGLKKTWCSAGWFMDGSELNGGYPTYKASAGCGGGMVGLAYDTPLVDGMYQAAAMNISFKGNMVTFKQHLNNIKVKVNFHVPVTADLTTYIQEEHATVLAFLYFRGIDLGDGSYNVSKAQVPSFISNLENETGGQFSAALATQADLQKVVKKGQTMCAYAWFKDNNGNLITGFPTNHGGSGCGKGQVGVITGGDQLATIAVVMHGEPSDIKNYFANSNAYGISRIEIIG